MPESHVCMFSTRKHRSFSGQMLTWIANSVKPFAPTRDSPTFSKRRERAETKYLSLILRRSKQRKPTPFLKGATNNHSGTHMPSRSSAIEEGLGRDLRETETKALVPTPSHLGKQPGRGHRTVPFLQCTFQMIISPTVAVKS